MKFYDKLVRDKIPEIIKKDGKEPLVDIIQGEELELYLNKKLQEEVDEYIEDGSLEELADILEVIQAIVKDKGLSMVQLEKLREEKKRERGGFDKGIRLKGVKDE